MYKVQYQLNNTYPTKQFVGTKKVLLQSNMSRTISFKENHSANALGPQINKEELSQYFNELNKAYINPDFKKQLKELTYNLEMKPPQNGYTIHSNNTVSFSPESANTKAVKDVHGEIKFKPFYSTSGENKVLMSDKPIPLMNFYKVDDSIYRGGQPGVFTYKAGVYDENVHLDMNKIKTDIEFLRDQFKIKTIVNLRHNGDSKRYPDINDVEERIIEELNNEVLNGKSNKSFVRYINKPLMNDDLEISRSNVLTIINILKNKDNYPMYIHCATGRDRTGIVSALYKILIKNTNIKEVVDELIFTDFDLQKRHGLVKDLLNLLESKIDKLPDFYINHFHSINQLKNLTSEELKTYGEILKKLFAYK